MYPARFSCKTFIIITTYTRVTMITRCRAAPLATCYEGSDGILRAYMCRYYSTLMTLHTHELLIFFLFIRLIEIRAAKIKNCATKLYKRNLLLHVNGVYIHELWIFFIFVRLIEIRAWKINKLCGENLLTWYRLKTWQTRFCLFV